MKFSAPTIFALLTPVPGALASLQSPPFTISSSTSYPANPTLDNQPLISFSFHPGGFFYPVLGAGTALIGYLNGSDTDNPITDLTLEFDNVPGWEGSPFGFDFDPNAGAAPYTTVTLQYGPGNKGMNVENGELRYDGEGSAPGLFFACVNPVKPADPGTFEAPAGQLFYALDTETLPSGCSGVTLDVTYV